MKAITYTLRNDKNNSDVFYSELGFFTSEVIKEAERSCLNYVVSFREYLRTNKTEKIRTDEEYLFEFLTIGVLWLKYSNAAGDLKYPSYRLLAYLYNLRQKNKAVKKYVDFVRGILSTAFLYRKNKGETPAAPSFKNYIKLLNWMQASGEFKEEVKRLELWKMYFKNAGEAYLSDNHYNLLGKEVLISGNVAENEYIGNVFQAHNIHDLDLEEEIEMVLENIGKEMQ